MAKWWETDPRVVKWLQLTFATLVLIELWQRWPLRRLLYGSESLLSLKVWFQIQGKQPRLSLLSLSSAEWLLNSCFLIAACSALVLIYRVYKNWSTHWCWLSLIICTMSLYGRCWIGDTSAVLIQRSALLFIFLIILAPSLTGQYLASFGLRLQFALIYLFNGLQKDGETWLSGEALNLFMKQDRINTPFALWCVETVPKSVLQGLTWTTLLFELSLPFLMMSPSSAYRLRSLAILMIISLHGTMLLLVDLSCFPLTMIALTPILLTSWHFRLFSAWISSLSSSLRSTSIFTIVSAWIYKATQQTNKSSAKGSYIPKVACRLQPPRLKKLWSYIHLSFTTLLLIMIVSGTLIDNPITHSVSPNLPTPLSNLRRSLDLKQWWSLYAPDVPKKDGWALIALWNGKRWLDPRSGQSPKLSAYPALDRQWSGHLERIAHELVRPSLKPLRDQLQKWFLNSNEHRGGIRAVEKVYGGEYWWVSETAGQLQLHHISRWGKLPKLNCTRKPCWLSIK